jgi:hypothetical protein
MNARARLCAIAALFAVLLSACRIVTPQELVNFETHVYPGRSQAEVFAATVTALKSIGYEVVMVDKAAFRIKTAPKVVMVHAAATSSSTAVATNDTVAWNIDVLSASDGASMHAEPRLYRGSASVEPSTLNYDFADNLFRTLYAEIDSDLPPPGQGPPPAAAPAASAAPAKGAAKK